MKKHITSLMLAGAVSLAAAGANATDLKVYINPGHGGHDSNDRNVVIAPYAPGDPNGYWESNSNLEKGLALRDMLVAKGYTVGMSRVTNTTADDLGLSTIVRLANESKADIYFSIHSNATGTSARRNFPLMLFRGYDNEPVKPNDKVLCGILNKHLLENQVTYWTSTATNIRGDWSFYKDWGTSGLGALRGITMTGMLSEGSFHDYIPEAYRLMNKDFCWLEAYHFRRAIDEYFNVAGESKGHIFGRINDRRLPREGSYVMFGEDKLATIQKATVELCDATGKVLDTYVTEEINTNGVYGFRNLEPGTYIVKTKIDSHYPEEQTVEVKADLVSYANFMLNKVRSTPPTVTEYSPVWKEGDEPVLCNTKLVFNFNWDMDIEATEKAFSIEPATEGTFTWEDLNYRMVFTPTEPYKTNTLYTVTLNTTTAHGGGLTLEKPFSFTFRTTDRNFMEVLAISPEEDAEVHYQNVILEIRTDKRPDIAQVQKQVKLYDADGNSVNLNNRKLRSDKPSDPFGFVLYPVAKPLVPGKSYRLHISADYADRDGIKLQNGIDKWFTAVDATAHESGTIIDPMDTPTEFAANADESANTATQTVTLDSSTALYEKALKFGYAFTGKEGGEAMWNVTADHPVTATRNDALTVHVDGDLSANGLYLLFSSEISQRYVHVTDLKFRGWRAINVPLTDLEGDDAYTFKGVRIVQNQGALGMSGSVGIDRIELNKNSGVEATVIDDAGLTVGPCPASDYLVANADYFIEGIELTSLDGRTIARAAGNALYVGDIAAGHYIATIISNSRRATRRVIIAH